MRVSSGTVGTETTVLSGTAAVAGTHRERGRALRAADGNAGGADLLVRELELRLTGGALDDHGECAIIR